jgi:tRNA A-37 threonylcarbamoyl transferase component Bud32
VSVVGIVLSIVTHDTTAFHAFLLVYMIYSFNPLVLIHTQSFPKSTWAMIQLMTLIVVIIVVLMIIDIVLRSKIEFYIFSAICGVLALIVFALLFRKHARSYKSVSVIIHSLLIIAFIGVSVGLNYVNTFTTSANALIVLSSVRSFIWVASAFTSLWVMVSDTLFWRGLADLDRLFENIESYDPPILQSDLSDAFAGLVRSNRGIFIDYGYIKIGDRIASGGRSRVYEGDYHNKKVALKVYMPAEITREAIAHWSQEVGLSVLLKHPNVIECYGLVVVPPKVIVVFEYCRYNLADYLSVTRISALIAISLMIDISCALDYLHDMNVIHRDLKAENIMICKCEGSIHAKIIDFGESRHLTRGSMTIIGTPQYLAPEVLNVASNQGNRSFYDQKADVFSLSIVFWEILHNGGNPYPRTWSMQDILLANRNGYRPPIHNGVHGDIIKLIESMWSTNPMDRPHIKYVYKKLLEFQKRYIKSLLASTGELLWTDEKLTCYFINNNFVTRKTETKKLIQFIRDYNLAQFTIKEEED